MSCFVTSKCAEHRTQRSSNGVWVNSNTPAIVARFITRFYIGNGSCLRALAKSMFGVVLDIEVGAKLAADCMHKCINWSVALANESLTRAVDINLCRNFCMSSCRLALQLMADQVVNRELWQVLVLKGIPQHHRADFGTRVFSDVLNGLRELNLQASR